MAHKVKGDKSYEVVIRAAREDERVKVRREVGRALVIKQLDRISAEWVEAGNYLDACTAEYRSFAAKKTA